MLAPASLAKLRDAMVSLKAAGVATATSLVTPDGDGVVPDGFRPSKQLGTIGDGMKGDDGTTKTDSASLLDPKVSDGLDTALAYVNGLGLAYPDVAGGAELRAVTGGVADAQDIIDRVRKQSVLSTQLRTLASSITSPTAAAGMGSGGSTGSSSLMSDYLDELGTAWPEVSSLAAYKDAVAAAKTLEKDATIGAALDLSAAFEQLAVHFDGRPDATLSPKSLSDTAAARELKREAKKVFGALPDQFTALAAVFATRPDDIFVPTTLTGEDGRKVQDAVDAFVSRDHTATRFYVTSSDDPYSGGAFAIVRRAQGVLNDVAPAFGPAASAYLGGPTAQFADVQDTLSTDFQRVGIITVLGIFLVLVILLRAIVAPLYLVATVLISYASAVGLSAWFFQEVLGQPGVSFYLPLMVFVLLVALGSDYNIFLMSRVREESEHRPIKDGIRIASGHTGAVITSAGLILAGTFGSMATAPLVVLFQVGVAVAVGVLIDTFLVRSILVPAITTLVGDRAWWPSGSSLPRALGWGVPAGAGAGAGSAAGVAAAGAVVPGIAAAAVEPGTVAARAGGPSGVVGSRLSRRALAGALALVVLVPVTVAALLTWSLGNQASNLSSVRAAVVNLDEGGSLTAADGTVQALQLGGDLAASLAAPGTDTGVTWEETSAADAASGLAGGQYAAVLTVPADFSRSVAALRSDPTGRASKASLRLATDDSSGYTKGTVARAVMAAINQSTSRGITASYVDDVLLSVTHAQAGFAGAAGGATGVADSASSLASDAAGVGSVASELATGLQELADGAAKAQGGTDKLVSGTAAMATGTRKLASGAYALAAGVRQAADGADQLAAGAVKVSDGAAALKTQTAGLPSQTDELATGAEGVAAFAGGVATKGAEPLAAGLSRMADETKGYAAGVDQLNTMAGEVAKGTTGLNGLAKQADAVAGPMAKQAGTLNGDVATYTSKVTAIAAECTATLGAADPLCSQLTDLAATNDTLTGSAGQVAADAGQVAGYTDSLVTRSAGLAKLAAGLAAGTAELNKGAPALEHGIADASDGASALAAQSKQLADLATQEAQGVRMLADGTPALASGISQLAAGAAGVSSGATSLAGGLGDLASGADQLATGAKVTAAGATKLASGTAQAAGGVGQLTGAVQQSVDAAKLVQAEAGNVADNGTTLKDNAKQLASNLDATAGSMHAYAADTRERMGELAADPVTVQADRLNGASGPGGGLAPFFLALAIWLGALGVFLVLPGTWRADGRRPTQASLVAFAAAAAVVGIGAVLAVFGLRLVGTEVAQLPGLLLFAVLTALVSVAIVQALVAPLGARGWLLALMFLVVQVAAVGFLYPASTPNGLVAALHTLVPMTYAVDAFRGAMNGAGSSPAADAVVLVGWLVVTVLVTLAVAAGSRLRDEEAEPVAG